MDERGVEGVGEWVLRGCDRGEVLLHGEGVLMIEGCEEEG